MLTLYHCASARSFRCLWALEEMQIPYELKLMAFPPRASAPEFLHINALGTVPAMLEDKAMIIESAASLQYLAGRHGPTPLAVMPAEDGYAAWLNWTHFGETSLTVPLSIILRYQAPERRDSTPAARDYTDIFIERLAILEQALQGREYLAAERFTIADISVHYALDLAAFLGLAEQYPAAVADYARRLRARPGYRAARRAQTVPPA